MKDLLAYSRAGKSEQTWILIDLNQAMKQVIKNLHSEITASQAQITVDQLPKVLVNPTEINQLLQNILENAIKFRRDEEELSIKLSSSVVPEGTQFQVSDNGIGIDLERYGAKLFHPFVRLTTDHPGAGTGLSLIKNMLEKTGEEITAKSQPGEGTTFTILFKNQNKKDSNQEEQS